MTESRPTETTSLWNGASARAPIGLLAPGTALGDRYEIREVLGHGGFAVVYLTRDRELGRDVALKVLREDRLTPGSLSRLKREVRVARDLAHENVVRIYDIESAGSAIFVTLEAVGGGSLRDRIRRGPLPVETAIGIAIGLFRGLQALHGVGIVHRDVKPGNVLLTDEGTVKLADFGLALHLEGTDTRVTATETAVGTLEYLAPEQALGEEVDPRTDLYAAGVVLFEMLTGRLPHEGRSSLGNLIARFQEVPPDLAALRPDTPGWLSRLVARLLARDRRERYPSAAAVLHDLERRRAAVRPSRRRRLAVAALALAALAAAAATIFALEARGRRFSHVASEGDSAVVGVDRRGRALWRHEDVLRSNNFVPFRREAERPPLLAATLVSAQRPTLDSALRLRFLDPQSGRQVDEMFLPDISREHFAAFSRTYGVRLDALDSNGDGADELLATFTHSPYWPSFTMLVDPAARRAWTLLVASGHHFYLGAADLDGDGQRELLLGGVNNRMGWRVGVAAVRSPVAVGPTAPSSLATALSGDRFARAVLSDALLWYAVGPRRLLRPESSPISISPAERRLTFAFWDRSTADLDFDGFAAGSEVDLDPSARQAARNAAYFEAADGARLLEADQPAAALPYFERAAARARAASDRHLEGWIAQSKLEALALAGRAKEAESAVEEALALEPDAGAEIFFAAARAWHRAGDLEAADAAYARAESSPGFSAARPAYETLEGRVLALVELGRFEAARAVIRSYARSYAGNDTMTAPYERFVDWRSGGQPAPVETALATNALDLHRYWNLEARAEAGEDPRRLLDEVGEERARATNLAPLLDSLESELLARHGDPAAALPLARRALADLDLGLPHQIPWRAHRPLLEARLARLEAAASAHPSATSLPRATPPPATR